ncbi:MAG: hypothetical protein QHI48_12565 [Bacteroidota bacterium]|nr:hypothetical protein [Bacteroidota bacterium]
MTAIPLKNRRRLVIGSLFLFAAAVFVIAAFFRSPFLESLFHPKRLPELAGTWKNANGETIELRRDSTVLLGMVGVDGGINARFSVHGDTLIVTTAFDEDDLGRYRKRYDFLVTPVPALEPLSITIERGGDFETLYLQELVQHMRKPRSSFTFHPVRK